MITVVTIFVWFVASTRVVMTHRSGWHHWRSALTFTTLALAGVVSLYLWRQQLDDLWGVPNASGLIARLLVVSGLISVQWSLTWPSRRGRWISGLVGGLSLLVLVAAWSLAPLHTGQVSSYRNLMSHPAVQLYTLAFYGEVLVILAQLVCGFWGRCREAAVSEDRVGCTVFALAAVGCVPIMGTLTAWSADVLLPGGSPIASALGRVLLFIGAFVLAAAMSWIPLGTWFHAQLDLLQVSSGWSQVVAAHPEVRLRSERWDRLFRPELVLVRRLIEMEDAREEISHGADR